MDVPPMIFADPALIDTIVGELKSQGTFDQFRKECIADVDTKPAYQNLHQRVESTVSNFLEGKTWRPDLNKNQLRDSLRKHIFEMGFLETGVERIVDQVVNPKVHSVFMPQVEDVVYRVQGIPKPEKKNVTNTSTTIGSASKNGGVFSQPPSFLPGLSFLPPALQNHIQKPPTLEDLLPTDLDPVSPESSKDSADESENMLEESGIIKQHDDSMESQLSGISDLTSHGSNHGESGIKNEDLNDDSQQSKISSSSKVSCVSNKLKTSGTKDHDTTPDTDVCQDEVEQTLEEAQENIYPTGPLVQYGDQYSMEEEVATTVSNINNETPTESNAKKDTNFFVTDGSLNSEETKLKVEENDSESECAKRSPTCELGTNVVDESSLAQSEDSQFSGSSDNKLLIDEMKDFNSQSGNSQQPEDEQSSMKTSSEGFLSEDNSKTMVVENVVEASEEARHGFEDSQDALERPPLPHTPPPLRDANERPPLPPDSSPEIIERPPLPRTPPFASRQDTILPPPPLPPLPPPPPPPTDDAVGAMESTTPPPPNTPPMPQGFSPPDGLYPSPIKATVKHSETDRLDEKRSYTPRSTTPTTEYPGREQPSTPPGPPPMDSLRVKRPPLPETPPLGDRLKGTDCPPLPPLPPPVDICEGERPPLPLTPPPPLAEKTLKTNLERPPTPQATILSRTPPPIPEEEFSRDSAVSYEEGAVPKTPHWEPETEEERPAPSSDEHLGISDAAKLRQSFSTSPKISNGQDEVSQSGSEEMQLAWSPLSNHGDEGNDDSGGKHTSEEKLSVEDAASKDPSPQEKLKRSSSESNREHKKDDSIKSESDKHKDRDHIKDGKSRERRKEDDNDRSRKDSSSSSKRHDDRSSKYRESSSRSKHDDKNRSDKDRDRHSSHHRSDDRRRDEKERSSSSRHKSSRSDDRHRHRDREQKHGSSGSRHEDRNHDKSSKSEDRSKSSKSSDRDRDRERDRDRDRKDSDRKERDNKDKEKKVDKDKERSRKDSSRSDEKKREKEREKEKRDKSSTICRPNNDRKSPDPDSNNGSTFGGNNHGSSGREDHPHDNSNQESNKGSGSTDSNSKSSDSSQQNNLSADLPSTSCNQSCSLSSSLPFKKRPLVTENEALDDFPCGQQIILKIKKFKKCGDDKLETTKRRKIKVVRRLEKEVIRNLNKYPRTLHQVNSGEETLEPGDVSPTEYFENDWPSKPNDQDFLAYIENLEQSKNLSGLSDWSETESEDEEVLHCDDIKDLHSGLEERDMIFSLCLLPDALAPKFSEPKSCNKTQETNDRLTKSSNSIKATKRIKQRKTSESESGIKRHKTLSKDVKTPVPIEQKSRRARKPNKRYSNDEFTSHFDNEDELDMIEEEPVLVPCSQAEKISAVASCTSATPWKNNEKSKSVALPDNDLQEKENKLNLQTSKLSSVVIEQKPIQNDHPTTYSWNKDSYNSNSEDEMDSTNTESDLIGTALKNLMMESGLGGPDEVSGSQKLPSTPRHTLTNSLSAINTKTIPLSGVKRVGLSRNYKGNKKLPVKQSIASASCGQFSLPPSPESDVSASSCDKGSGSKLQGSKSDASDLDSNAESSKLCISRVKQHYSSGDLYKPRPPLRLTSKRAKAVTEQNGLL